MELTLTSDPGDRFVSHYPNPTRAPLEHWRWSLLVALALTILSFSLVQEAAAEAPPLAVATTEVTVFSSPDLESEPVGSLPGGSTVELTGESAPGFIAVVAGGAAGWVPADQLSVSGRPGIDTAVAVADTSLREAPFPDAGIVKSVPAGESVMLTGATVGGYDAASRDGAGGWIDRLDIVRKVQP